MNLFEIELQERLAQLRQQGLDRQLRTIDSAQGTRIQVEDRLLVNFSSNDYLGLANHPALKQAASEAVRRYGAGAGASRLVCGNLRPHRDLEECLAAFKGTPAALSFSSGYAAAQGAIGALLGPADVIILDKLVHACIVDAARLSGATLRVFHHNDLNQLEHLLDWAQKRLEKPANPGTPKGRVLVATESVFSMDGDQAPLREIVALKARYRFWLLLDEAHATGLFGANRRGLAEQLDVAPEIELQMGTLGKAAGASGGYICGSRALIDYLISRARSFIFSTAPIPAAAAAAQAGIQIIGSAAGEELRQRLWRLVSGFQQPPGQSVPISAILPLHIGGEEEALAAAAALRRAGIFIPAIRYPAVARGQARLRLTITAAHTEPDLELLKAGLSELQIPPHS